jgi:DNA-binding MltR family transcriptional regulator
MTKKLPEYPRGSIGDSMRKKMEIWRELAKQTDRGVAIIGAAIIEDELKRLIIRSFANTNNKVRGMFDPDGAMGAFGSQTTLAYAMGLVSQSLYVDLNLIREIRNKFAHRVHFARSEKDPEVLVTLEHRTIDEWVKSLKCPAATGFMDDDPRRRLVHTCEWLWLHLGNQDKVDGKPVLPVEYVIPSDDGPPF